MIQFSYLIIISRVKKIWSEVLRVIHQFVDTELDDNEFDNEAG